MAARLGLPYAFASHFAPDYLQTALEIYRSRFEPSEVLFQTSRDGGGECLCRRHGCRGSAPFHHAPATLSQSDSADIPRKCRRPWMKFLESDGGSARAAHDPRVRRWAARKKVRAQLQAIVAATGADEIIATAHISRPRGASSVVRDRRREFSRNVVRTNLDNMTKAYAAQSATSSIAPFSLTRRDPLPNDVEIDILYCGVCHSDIHQARNRMAPTPFIPAYRATKSSDGLPRLARG